MAQIIFYERPCSASSARHKAWLIASGHDVDVRNILTEPWHPSSLRPYFGALPLREWFDPSSPRIMSGEIVPDVTTPQEALVMMIMDPALIRHPLMRIGDHCEAGFDACAVEEWIGLTPAPTRTAHLPAHLAV